MHEAGLALGNRRLNQSLVTVPPSSPPERWRASARVQRRREARGWATVTTIDENERMHLPSDSAPFAGRDSRRIGLVGCVKEKAAGPRAAKDLYVSTLFSGRRSFVERSCARWWILSAEHGLVHPDEVLCPYDVTLKDSSRSARREWSARVLGVIDAKVQPSPGDIFEIHAGAEYRDFGLVEGLRARGCKVEIPTEGMRIGHQLQFYSRAEERSP